MNPKIKFVIRCACNSLCGVLLLVSINAPAQNLFVTTGNLVVFGKAPGNDYEFTPGGVRSTFASVTPSPQGLKARWENQTNQMKIQQPWN